MFARHRKYRADVLILAKLNLKHLRGASYENDEARLYHKRLSREHRDYVNSWQYKLIVDAQVLWQNIRYSRPVVLVGRFIETPMILVWAIQGLADRMAPEPEVVSPAMSDDDKFVIQNYAKCEKNSLKIDAIRAHQKNIPIIGVRGNIFQKFMAEVDNPAPDLVLRAMYRDQVIKEIIPE